MFNKLEGEQAVLVSGGSYTVRDIYEYDGRIFAGNGSTFIQLYKNGGTSKFKIKWDACTYKGEYDSFGRMQAVPVRRAA